MQLKELKERINEDLQKGLMPANIILRQFCMFDESARESIVCVDSSYFPFYYHLGKYIQPESLIEIGLGIGLVSGSFMSTCKSVKRFLGFNSPKKENSWRIGRLNVLNVNSKLQETDCRFALGNFKNIVSEISKKEWDLVLMNEVMDYDSYRYALDVLWDVLVLDGYMVVDKISSEEICRKCFDDFVKSKNREYVKFETLYGSGIIMK
jgi:hypothetical protein